MATILAVNSMTQMTFADDKRWQAVLARDRAQDGAFYYGVSTTGIFCRPSCPSRRPRRESVRFFETAEAAESAGFRACLRCRPLEAEARRAPVQAICRFLEAHAGEPVRLRDLAREFRMSPFHLQRVFKAAMGISPREYAEACRVRQLKDRLRADESVTTAMHAAGYGSASRLYEGAAERLGMTPGTYRKGAAGVVIRYFTVESPIGRLLVASTDKGVCSIQFGGSEAELVKALRREYPGAELKRRAVVLDRWIAALLRQLYGEGAAAGLPLDIRATAFQQRVWNHLRQIPYGATESYAEVARAIGEPHAARAVARACGSNPVALAIPCHRVVRSDGGLGGYRWGLKRKAELLRLESGKEG